MFTPAYVRLILGIAVLDYTWTVGTMAIRLTKTSIPKLSATGDKVFLICEYDTEDDTINSVKWFKDDQEFIRYSPGESEELITFTLPGVKVNKYQSREQRVVLDSVEKESSGVYQCEVMAEGLPFHSATFKDTMNVVDIPKSPPVISGLHQSYSIGDILNVTCISSYSRPVANITWYINNKKTNENDLIPYPDEYHHDGFGTSRLGLYLRIIKKHFENETLKLRCETTIGNLYWKSEQKVVLEDRSSYFSVQSSESRERLLSGSGLLSSLGLAFHVLCYTLLQSTHVVVQR